MSNMNFGTFAQGVFPPNSMPQPLQQNIEPPKKERLRLKMSSEERGFFSGILEIADKQGTGRLDGKEAADFLKRSGLPRDVLKEIWIIAAQTNPQCLERDEFYIALRLIALAQNNMEYSEDSIRFNNPIPPLPKFDLKTQKASRGSVVKESREGSLLDVSDNSNKAQNETEAMFAVTDPELEKYTLLFNKNKDFDNKISLNKAYQMWISVNISTDILQKIFTIVTPLKDSTSLTLKEFQIVTHLIYKSQITALPFVLPNVLKKFLFEEEDATKQEVKFSNEHIDFSNKLGGMQVNINPQVVWGNINDYHDNAGYSLSGGNISSKMKSLKENLTHFINEMMNENKFLNKIAEDDSNLLNSLVENGEKMNRQISLINDKNKQIKDQITDIRRKINIEKDNLAKASLNFEKKQQPPEPPKYANLDVSKSQEQQPTFIASADPQKLAGTNIGMGFEFDKIAQFSNNQNTFSQPSGFDFDLNNRNPVPVPVQVPVRNVPKQDSQKEVFNPNTMSYPSLGAITSNENKIEVNPFPENNARNAVQSTNNLGKMNSDFDFETFNNEETFGGFKEFAQKEGDDNFKKHSNLDKDWDF